MKKSLLSLSVLLSAGLSFSQTIMSENFDASTNLPAGWAQYNVDGLTVASNLSSYNFGTKGWVVANNIKTNVGNHVASTSWYNPAGTSNDWLVSPSIAIPGTGTYSLQFDVVAQDPQYPDGFKVYINTTGNQVADFAAPAVLTVAAAPTTYTTQTIDLSAFAGQTIYVGIQNNSTDKFLLFVDNFMVRQPQANDAILLSSTLNRYSMTNTANTLSLDVKNNGSTPITSITVDWNDGTAHSQTINTNIAVGATANVNHPTAINYATVVEKTIAINITQVNGAADPVPADNTASKLFNTLSALSAKTVLFEEGTGTWCGWCPRGAVAMEYMNNLYPNTFVGIAVHNGDPMTVTAYDAAADFSGFPGSNVDRVILGADVSNTDFQNNYNSRINVVVPASVNGVVSGTGNNITIDASATFRSVFSAANYRLAVVMVEDHVTGTSSGYDQKNYYSSSSQNVALNGAGHNWQNEPNPVPAANMVYDHVGRALLGGYTGQTGSVSTTITDGQTATYQFTYTVPATSVRNNMHAVVLLIDQATGEVINAKSIPAGSAGITETAIENMAVYPNPASEAVTVSFDGKGGDYAITITDLSGRIVSSQTISANGTTQVSVSVADLNTGNYLISVANATGSHTQNLLVK
jgi:hypothetical protein